MKFPVFFLAAWLLLTAATAPARAGDIAPADAMLMDKFDQALRDNDVEAAKKLIAAPNFRPTMKGDNSYSLFEKALVRNEAIARLIMASPAWKKTPWNARNSAGALNLAATDPSLLPMLQELSRQPHFDLGAPGSSPSPLAIAANSGNMAALKWLAKQPSVNINARDENGYSAVFDAQLNAVEFLISLPKFDVNARTLRGQTALHYAVEMQQIAKVSALLKSPRIDPNLRDRAARPRTPLDIALALRDSDIWEQRDADGNNITTSGADIASVLLKDRRVRSTPAQRALFKRLMKSKPYQSPPDLLPFPGTMTGSNDFPPAEPLSPTQSAWLEIIEKNDVEAARHLIKQPGFDAALPLDDDPGQDSPDPSIFSRVLERGDAEIALLMMDAMKSDAYLQGPKRLDGIGKAANLAVLKKIIARPKFDLNRGVWGSPLIFTVVEAGNIEGTKLLLADPRVDPTLRGYEGAPLLSLVAGTHSAALAKLLLADPRIDPTATDDEGNTALHCAIQSRDAEVVGALLADARVKVNARNKAGETPVAYYGDLDVALLMLRDARVEFGAAEVKQLDAIIKGAQDELANEDKIVEARRLMSARAIKK